MSDTQIGALDIVLAGDDASFLQAMGRCEQRIAKLTGTTRQFGPAAASSFAQAEAGANRFGHASVSQMQAASAALRELNGNFTNNIRAVERFVTTIPGVGAALRSAFPVVGAVAFGAVIFEAGQKVRQFIKETEAIPQHIKDGFNDLNQALRLANDSMAQSNDRLEAEAERLEKKPGNGLQLALDEARQSADKLSDSLSKDIVKVNELLEKNKVGFWAKLMGQSGTKDSSKFVTDVQSKIDAIRSEYGTVIDQATDAGNSPEHIAELKQMEAARLIKVYADAHAQNRAALKDLQDQQYDFDRSNGGLGSDQRANINIRAGFEDMMSGQEKEIGESFRGDSLNQRVTTDRGNAGAGEAQRKAAEAQLKAFEDGLAKLKADHQVGLAEEYGYWTGLLNAAAKYPDNLRNVMERVASVNQQMYRASDEAIKQAVAAQKKGAEETAQIFATLERINDQYSRAEHHAADAAAQLTAEQQKTADALAEWGIQQDAATGRISKYSAAVQLAQAHLATYQAQLRALDAEAAADLNDTSLSDEERTARADARKVKSASIQGQIDLSAAQAKVQEFSDTALGGAIGALQRFTAEATDASARIAEITNKVLGDVNGAILKDLTSKNRWQRQGAWTHAGKSIFSSVADTGLKGAEGSLMKAFGLGKLGLGKLGTKGNPMYVRGADAATGAANMAIPGLSSLGSGAGAGVAAGASGAGSIASGFTSLLAAIPGFASGVDNFSGGPAWVGEKGPELLNLPRGSSVIPSHRAATMGGHTFHINVDASNSHDPAMVEQAVNRGIASAAPSIIAASVHATNDHRSRMPPSRRM